MYETGSRLQGIGMIDVCFKGFEGASQGGRPRELALEHGFRPLLRASSDEEKIGPELGLETTRSGLSSALLIK